MKRICFKMFRYLILHFLFFSAFIFPLHAASDTVVNPDPQILFIVPQSEPNRFWDKSIKFMQAVANSLNIRHESLLFKSVDRNRFAIVSVIKSQLAKQKKPNMIVTTFAFMAEKNVLDILESHKTPFLTINTKLTPRIINEVGLPREKYKYWLGHVAPDDKLVGKQLAEYLIQHTPVKEKNMIGLGGPKIHSAGYLRSVGLELAVKNNDGATLIQSVETDWSVSASQIKTLQLLKRHKEHNVNIIWAAADALVDGAIKAIDQLGNYKIGENIWLGGVDWNGESIEHIKNNQQFVSFGGHFVEGGLATIILHDYINGIDFKEDVGLIINTPMYPLTSSNIEKVASNITPEFWDKIDFSLLSKKGNPKLKRYNLSVPSLLAIEIKQ